MPFPKLRRHALRGRSSARRGSDALLPPTPLDGGVISCQVHDDRGRLLPDAVVTVVDRFSRQSARGTTDSYGYFVAAVSPGVHTVSVSAGGYRRRSVQAEVGVNQYTALGGLQLEPSDTLALPQPGVWRFDPDHTEVRFTAQHIGMSKIHGKFKRFSGGIRITSPFELSSVEVVIDAASIDTGVPKRDQHLRSADFLDVANYPALYFIGDRLEPVRGDRWLVSGALTLRNTTSPVRLETTYLGLRSWNGTRAACVCKTELRREDYSINWQQTLAKGIAVVGSTVQIELDVQAVLDGSQ